MSDNAAKERLHLADVDYFPFRKEAADLTNGPRAAFQERGHGRPLVLGSLWSL